MSARYDDLLAAAPLPRLEGRMLLEAASGRDRTWLIAHGDEAAPPSVRDAFQALVAERVRGVPIAYLTGRREFFGREFRVDPSVLIPRPETELLVRTALELAPPGASVLELGTGSGCIAVTLACERDDLVMTATDLGQRALEIARDNAERLCGAERARSIRWRLGDWYDALAPSARFDLIVSNPPYVAPADPHLARGDLRFEPSAALVAGEDGLADLDRLITGAPARLEVDGRLALEHGFDQAERVRARLDAAGFDAASRRDDVGHERVTTGRLRG